MDSLTLSEGQISPFEKSPTPCDTPDPLYGRSQLMTPRSATDSPRTQLSIHSPDVILKLQTEGVTEKLKNLKEAETAASPSECKDT